MVQELVVENNTKLNSLAHAIDETNSVKSKLEVRAQNINHQNEETRKAITILSKNMMTLNAKLEDARKLAEAKMQDQVNLSMELKNPSFNYGSMIVRKEQGAKRMNNKQRVISMTLAEIQPWKSKF